MNAFVKKDQFGPTQKNDTQLRFKITTKPPGSLIKAALTNEVNISKSTLAVCLFQFTKINSQNQQKLWDDLEKEETPEAWFLHAFVKIHITVIVHSFRIKETRKSDTSASMACIPQSTGTCSLQDNKL